MVIYGFILRLIKLVHCGEVEQQSDKRTAKFARNTWADLQANNGTRSQPTQQEWKQQNAGRVEVAGPS